jgi:hypothetical protein|tara:strand:+ start:167 stop:394 length:228 start_codon:yes stop_codon:yes gene_type:complete
MPGPALRERAKDEELRPVELEATLARDPAEIVDEAERTSDAKEAEVSPWLYFIPSPGVRYYAYREWPSPVVQARR